MTYRTIEGDTFDWVSYKELGSERYVETLINANRAHVSTVIFKAGVELELPSITEEVKVSKLPPWRRS